MHRFVWRLLPLLLLSVVATACQEDLRGGAACPGLCPEQAVTMRDTLLFPIVLDSTLVGYPPAGSEPSLLLTTRPDTVQTAVVIRFDQIPRDYQGPGAAPIMPAISFDSLVLQLPFIERKEITAPLVLEVFDVDTLAADTDLSAVRATIRPERLLTTLEFAPGDTIETTLSVELPVEVLEPRILAGQRVRLGVRLTTDQSITLRVPSTAGAHALLRASPVLETGAVNVLIEPVSATPEGFGAQVPEMADFTLVLQGTPTPPVGTLVVGGLPGRRVFMRFDLPAGLVETTTVVRAELLLTQVPNNSVGPSDTLFVWPRAVLAHPAVEPGKAALLLAEAGALGLQPVVTRPMDNGVRTFDVAQLVRQWRALDTNLAQRALVLQGGEEGLVPQEIHFFSSEAPEEADRPRLRLTYIPRSRFGLP